MKAAIYARVSTERQAERGTIGSQLEALRAHVAAAGDELAGEYRDDGHSGARLDRPGLDRCATPPRPGCSRWPGACPRTGSPAPTPTRCSSSTKLARLGVSVRFTDAPGLDEHDPQARLLTQVQGVIAEYERAKIGERYRRGKLFRVPRRRSDLPEGPLRLPAHPPRPRRPRPPGNLRARGRGGAADLRRAGRRDHHPPDLPPAQRRRRAHPHRQPGRAGHLDPGPDTAQRGLHRPHLLQPHRGRPGPQPRPPLPPDAPPPRRLDRDPLPGHHR